MIQLKNITKSYNSKRVLDNINLSLEEGKVYGLVGANGAGKTTLYNCIAAKINHEGEVHSDIIDLKDKAIFLKTNPYLMTLITGREYLRMICNAQKIENPKIDEKNIFDLPLDEYASIYSTGMAKKLAFMVLLHLDLDLIILDEPFNGVDIQSNMLILEVLKKLKSEGKTILISSHIFSTLEDICDEIILLEHGKISNIARKEGFAQIEQTMRDNFIGDRLNVLD